MISLYTVFTILHILGAVVGAGGALASDVIFIKSIGDGRINKTEFSFLNALSAIVWIGLILLIGSGIGLFSLDSARFLASTKFGAKITIVAIILLNGLLFHFLHIPFISKKTGSKLFYRAPKGEGAALILSGVVSATSWFSAVVLGSIKSIPLSYIHLISIYLGMLSIGTVFALQTTAKVLDRHEREIMYKTSFILLAIASALALLEIHAW